MYVILSRSFEEGVRAQISQELDDLRQQQLGFSDSLDQLLEQNDIDDDEE